MFKIITYLSVFIVTVYGSGEWTILHHPKSLIFKGHDAIKESVLTEAYSAALGFSTEKYSNWNGMFISDPFNLAEAIVTVAVDGVSSTSLGKGHHFPLKTDQDESDIFEALEQRVSERYPESDNNLVRVNLAEGLREVHKYDIFENIKSDKIKKNVVKHLKNSVEEDREFLKEISLLDAIITQVEQGVVSYNNVPDVFWFRIGGLHPLIDFYGENSTEVKEAKQLLNDVIIRLNSAFNKLYKGHVLISVIVSDSLHTRRARSILQSPTEEQDKFADLNLSKHYSKYYPVIFNIILWFGVAMTFTLLAISIAIATMDPGRDSIIYRMTSTRMKKDN